MPLRTLSPVNLCEKERILTVIWFSFVALVLALLALDLGVLHRKAHIVSLREALWMSAFWITLGLSFGVVVYYGYEQHWLGLGAAVDAVDGAVNNGQSATIKYLTGYVIEKSLSVDNIFVIAMVFGFFAVPAMYQHRVLFWGIIGALAMRAVMITVGAALIAEFHWILYLFGAFLIITAFKMFFLKAGDADPGNNIVVRLCRRFFPVTSHYHGEHFIVRAGTPASRESEVPDSPEEPDAAVSRATAGRLMLTPLSLALLVVETTDLIFAVDSIPAIFAITADPFLVFTSNVFAVLGLRSLYFALAGMLQKFTYLKPALALVLLVVGIKMLTARWLKEFLGENFNFYLLGAVLFILAAGVAASLLTDWISERRLRI
jgi:tellurite resistance protein TerC